ncbi:AMP-binding protein [soil metagenome]
MTDIIATCDWVFEHARTRPAAPAVDSPTHRLSYGVLARRVLRCSRVLGDLGVAEGDMVLIALPNVPGSAVVSLAVQHLGGICVEVSRDWTPEQIATVLAQTHARTVALGARDLRRLAPVLQAAGVRSVLVELAGPVPADLRASLGSMEVARVGEDGETGDAGEAEGVEPLPPAPPVRDPASATLLLYTSGSTGSPRAVVQTLANIDANSRSIVRYLELTADDRAMLILPLSYCYGRSVFQTHLMVGGSIFLDPRFMYPSVVMAAIGSERCTGFAGVPLTFELLHRRAQPVPSEMPALRYVTQAGGAMSPETIDWARGAFAPAKLFVMYGQTEATARLAYLPPARAEDKRGSIGIAIPDVELRVVDDDGADVAPGAPGNLIARGGNVTPGYHEAAAETALILRNGWLWTGDIARRDDDGVFFVVGRAKDIMKISGRRVSPAQIEAVLLAHPDVDEAAVAGIADALTGEAPAALVVIKEGATVSLEALHRFCTERLAHHLVPRVVRFAAQLPRNASGKLLRAEVARALAAPSEPPPAPSP